jgi:hypothetical protein
MNLMQLRDKYVNDQGFRTDRMRKAIEAAWMAGAVTALTNPPQKKPRAGSLRERLKEAANGCS